MSHMGSEDGKYSAKSWGESQTTSTTNTGQVAKAKKLWTWSEEQQWWTEIAEGVEPCGTPPPESFDGSFSYEGSAQVREALREELRTLKVENLEQKSMVDKIKECQRLDLELRTTWIHFTNAEANGVRDPTLHDTDFLRSFFRGLQDGSMDNYRRMRNPHRGADANEVFIGGVGIIQPEAVEKYFHAFGELRYVDIKPDKGFGFVKFDKKRDMDKCLSIENHIIAGKRIEVKAAENREPRSKLRGAGNPNRSRYTDGTMGRSVREYPARKTFGHDFAMAGHGGAPTMLPQVINSGAAHSPLMMYGADGTLIPVTMDPFGGMTYATVPSDASTSAALGSLYAQHSDVSGRESMASIDFIPGASMHSPGAFHPMMMAGHPGNYPGMMHPGMMHPGMMPRMMMQPSMMVPQSAPGMQHAAAAHPGMMMMHAHHSTIEAAMTKLKQVQ